MPKPTIMEGEVLIELHATSVNPIDWKLREGYLRKCYHLTFLSF